MLDLISQPKTFFKTENLLLAIALVALALFGYRTANAQYGGSLASMYDTIRSTSQTLNAAQNRYNEMTARAPGSSSGTVYGQAQPPYQPPARQFPITATDFKPASGFLLPDALANASTNLKPDEREAMRSLYINILSSFEREARKDNMANAFAFVIGTSIQVVDGKELSDDYVNRMIGYFNSRLAATPQYNAMPVQQKQALYESLVLTGGVIAFLDAQGKQTNNAAMRSQANQVSRALLKQLLGIDAR